MNPARVRLAVVLGVLLTAFVAATVTGVLPTTDDVRDWGESFGDAGPVVFVPLSAALNSVFVPFYPVMCGAAGLLFGTVEGLVAAQAGIVLAAVLQNSIARYVAGEQISEALPERVRRFDSLLERRGFFAVLYLRFVPALPFVLLNYASGLTSLKLRDLALGTAVGAVPWTFAYVALGGSLENIGSAEGIASIVLLAVLAAVSTVLLRRQVAEERAR